MADIQNPPEDQRSESVTSVEPLRKNQCTDVICLILFIVFFGIWIFVGTYALMYGDDNKILIPVDSYGRRCGHDSEVLDKPYLFIENFEQCVSPTTFISGCTSNSTCMKQCPPTSKPLSFHCVPDINVEKMEKTMENALSIPTLQTGVFSAIRNFFSEGLEELKATWMEICAFLIASIPICLVYIYIMRWLAKPIVWFTILALLGSLLCAGILSFIRYAHLKANPIQRSDGGISLFAYGKALLEKTNTWLWIGSIVVAIFFIFLLMTACFFTRIRLGIEIIKESSKAIHSSFLAAFFPVIPFIFQAAIIIFVIYVYLNLTTLSDPVYEVNGIEKFGNTCKCEPSYIDGDSCIPEEFNERCRKTDPGRELNATEICQNVTCHLITTVDSEKITWFKVVNVFGGLWFIFFMSAFNEMVLASIFSRWYWTRNKSKLPFCALCSAVGRTLRYHVGTLAFGSLIITICRILRMMIEYVDTQLNKYPNAVTRVIMNIFRCFFWCLEKFLKFVNKNAYIMCSMYGTCFCISAKTAFVLILSNGLRFMAISTISTFLFIVSKLLISLGLATVMFIFVHKYELIFPSIVVGVASYLISSLLFDVYSMAISTTFMCALEDTDKNDGSANKPYFMSKGLLKILTDAKANEPPKKGKPKSTNNDDEINIS